MRKTNRPLSMISLQRKGKAMFTHKAQGMVVDTTRTALVLTDMQNDFLSPHGAAYGLIADSLAANHTADNLEKLLAAAQRYHMPVFISPHYYYPHDSTWVVPLGPLEDLAHHIG